MKLSNSKETVFYFHLKTLHISINIQNTRNQTFICPFFLLWQKLIELTLKQHGTRVKSRGFLLLVIIYFIMNLYQTLRTPDLLLLNTKAQEQFHPHIGTEELTKNQLQDSPCESTVRLSWSLFGKALWEALRKKEEIRGFFIFMVYAIDGVSLTKQ